MKEVDIFWFRRDLRLNDNAGLYHALRSGKPILPLFIFDRAILDKLSNRDDARVTFIHNAVTQMKEELEAMGATLLVKFGKPLEVWQEVLDEYQVGTVFTNRDYEAYAQKRDSEVETLLDKNEIAFKTFKDHVIFEGDEVLKDDGTPYTVFTPYSRKWQARLDSEKTTESFFLKSYPCDKYSDQFLRRSPLPLPSLTELGFEETSIDLPPAQVSQKLIKGYADQRDYPATKGTSRLGVHFRFGTISIREKARKAAPLSSIYLSELIWRDFYSMILQHFPHVAERPFRQKYEAIAWRNDEDEFRAWCEGVTGYPLVDAGMRELNTTGFMHNRVRMVVASFLTKHLLIDYRWGEAYFAEKLLDFDLASNNGGWQWAAGCGTDAAPYFRIFNPESQMKKFDADGEYVRKWVPEFGTSDYPQPIVVHKEARIRCLETYKAGLEKA